MSAKLETNSINSQLTALRAKLTQLALSPELQNCSQAQSETQRLYFNKSNLVRNLNDVFLKETQRNHTSSHLHSPIFLTEKSSPSVMRQSRWQFINEADQQVQEFEKIQTFLTKQGLLQIFNSFQNFRSKMIQSLSQAEGSLTSRKIGLMEAIANFRQQLRDIYPDQKMSLSRSGFTVADQTHRLQIQIKNLLLQISALRRDNDKLRQKVSTLTAQMQGNDHQRSFQNSIMNNSISYVNSSLRNSQFSSQFVESVDSSVEYCKLHDLSPRLVDSIQIASKSTTISLQNSTKKQQQKQQISCKDENILEEESYQATSFQVEQIRQTKRNKQTQDAGVQTYDLESSSYSRKQWYQLVGECIKSIKKLFRHHFEAANLALRHPSYWDRLESVFKSYRTFKPQNTEKTECSYLAQCTNLIGFTLKNSEELSQMIQTQLISIKKSQSHD